MRVTAGVNSITKDMVATAWKRCLGYGQAFQEFYPVMPHQRRPLDSDLQEWRDHRKAMNNGVIPDTVPTAEELVPWYDTHGLGDLAMLLKQRQECQKAHAAGASPDTRRSTLEPLLEKFLLENDDAELLDLDLLQLYDNDVPVVYEPPKPGGKRRRRLHVDAPNGKKPMRGPQTSAARIGGKKPRMCRTCHQPMRGHPHKGMCMIKVGQIVKSVEKARFVEEKAKAELEAASMAVEAASPAPCVFPWGPDGLYTKPTQ